MRFSKAVLFDFDGVLCHDRFYESELIDRPEVYSWIQEQIFRDKEYVRSWMRGVVSWSDVNTRIAQATDVDLELINGALMRSVEGMKLDMVTLDIARSVRDWDMKVGIVTDNMDVFTQITAQRQELRDMFDVMINSADYGLLKNDQGGRLFDIALERLGISEYSHATLIDDSRSTIDLFEQKGGHAHHFTVPEALKFYMQEIALA